MMNTQQYLSMRREALKNDGIEPSIEHGDYDLLLWDTTHFTDWQRKLFGGTGKTTNLQSELSGGNAQSTFRLAAGYYKVTNIMTASGADQRASLSFNVNNRSLNQRFSVALTGTYTLTESDMINIPSSAMLLPPNAPAIYDSANKLNFDGYGGLSSQARISYPFFTLKQPYSSKTSLLNSNLVLGYEVLKGGDLV